MKIIGDVVVMVLAVGGLNEVVWLASLNPCCLLGTFFEDSNEKGYAFYIVNSPHYKHSPLTPWNL